MSYSVGIYAARETKFVHSLKHELEKEVASRSTTSRIGAIVAYIKGDIQILPQFHVIQTLDDVARFDMTIQVDNDAILSQLPRSPTQVPFKTTTTDTKRLGFDTFPSSRHRFCTWQ